MDYQHLITFIMEMLGTVAFASSGAMTAVEKNPLLLWNGRMLPAPLHNLPSFPFSLPRSCPILSVISFIINKTDSLVESRIQISPLPYKPNGN